MIVDTSAVLAVLYAEPDSERFARAIASAPTCRISAANYLEAAIVVEGRGGPSAGYELDVFIERSGIEVVSVTFAQSRSARRAWRRFGRGNHAAGLNFGDCFAYALAETANEPLLFKGGDFARTDIAVA